MRRYASAGAEYAQLTVYQSADGLVRLGLWLGQPNINIHRRGDRPKLCRPKPVYFGEINVAHPSCPRTKIVLQYNINTEALRITTSY